MGVCDLCGESAGWLRNRHPACTERAEGAKKALYDLTLNGTLTGKTFSDLDADVRQFATDSRVPLQQFRETMLQAANDAASKIALQSPVSQDEYRRVLAILDGWGIQEYLKTAEDYTKRRWFGLPQLDMSLILWQVLHGLNPIYDGTGRMQFNLQSGEVPIFTAGKVTYAEERTVSTHTRTFGGLSLPVGAGIYYHIGGSQGHQVSGLLPLDVGEMLITTHAIYFGGQKRTLRISLNHVVRYQPYLDGVGVCESHGAPKVFVTNYATLDTGWFFFNLLSALTSRLTQ
jgi:hypothetical protein